MKKLSLLFLLLSNVALAQECEKYLKIQDKQTHKPITEIRLIQGKYRIKAYADNGIYPITCQCHDTLTIDSDNYFKKKYFIRNSRKDTLLVELVAIAYNLKEVVVRATSEERFKEELVKDILEDIANNKPIISLPAADPLAYEKEQVKGSFGEVSLKGLLPKATLHPITALFDAMNHKKLNRQSQTAYWAKNLQTFQMKYNKEKVKQWTGFIGEKLDKFMDFCKMDFAFVVESADYEIIAMVKDCAKNFTEK